MDSNGSGGQRPAVCVASQPASVAGKSMRSNATFVDAVAPAADGIVAGCTAQHADAISEEGCG